MYEDDFSFEFDTEYDVEEMIAALKEAMPRNLMTVLNISKFKEVIAIVNVIVASIRRQCDDAKFTMNFDRGFGIDIIINEEIYSKLYNDSGKIRRILISSINTAKANESK